jgi:hypothetical protein
MDDLELIGPTRHYVIVCHDGRRISVDAEAMWPGRHATDGLPIRSAFLLVR